MTSLSLPHAATSSSTQFISYCSMCYIDLDSAYDNFRAELCTGCNDAIMKGPINAFTMNYDNVELVQPTISNGCI